MKEKIGIILGIAGILMALTGLVLYEQYPEKTILVSLLEMVSLGFVAYYFISHFTQISVFSKKRSTRMGTNSVLMTLFFTGILTILAVILSKHNARFDLSEEGKFSLSPQTVKILKNLKKEIKITAFVDEGSKSKEQANDLLTNFKYFTPHVQFELIDPVRHPAVARQYGITQSDTLVLEAEKQERRIRAINEEELINAIVRLNQERRKTIYFLEGHAEHKIGNSEKEGYSVPKEALERDGYEVKSLLLLQAGRLPDDASVLIVGGPMTALLSSEITAIDNYLSKGGKILFLIDPESKSGLEDLIEKYGVTLHKDLVIDPLSRLFGGDYTIPVVNSFPPNEITQDIKNPVFFPLARSMAFKKEKEGELEYKPLAESGPNSWGETKIQSGQAKYDPGEDFKGPVTIAASLSYKKKTENESVVPARWIVVGDSDFATNNFFGAAGNGDFFLNMVSWLGEEKGLISVRSNPAKSSTLFLTSKQGPWFFFVPLLIMPGFVLAAGLIVWKKRRNR